MKLHELNALYGNKPFYLAYVDNTIAIRPKEVVFGVNLTVWYDNGCIINGMQSHDFIHGIDKKSVVDQFNNTIDAIQDISKESRNILKNGRLKKKL